MLERAWILMPAQTSVAQMLATLVEFPPSQKPASFSRDQVMAKLQAGMTSA
jgi:arylsulfatase